MTDPFLNMRHVAFKPQVREIKANLERYRMEGSPYYGIRIWLTNSEGEYVSATTEDLQRIANAIGQTDAIGTDEAAEAPHPVEDVKVGRHYFICPDLPEYPYPYKYDQPVEVLRQAHWSPGRVRELMYRTNESTRRGYLSGILVQCFQDDIRVYPPEKVRPSDHTFDCA